MAGWQGQDLSCLLLGIWEGDSGDGDGTAAVDTRGAGGRKGLRTRRENTSVLTVRQGSPWRSCSSVSHNVCDNYCYVSTLRVFLDETNIFCCCCSTNIYIYIDIYIFNIFIGV